MLKHCRKVSLYSISRKSYDSNSIKWQKKTYIGPDLSPLGPNLGTNFFSKNLACSLTRYHVQLSSCAILEKTNDPILRELSDGRTDRQTDRQTDSYMGRWTDGQTAESDFIGRCPTNVERPILETSYENKIVSSGFSGIIW